MKNEVERGIVSRSIDSIRYYLTRSQKVKTAWMFVLSLAASVLDVAGLASLIPVMLVAAEPGGVLKNKYFAYLFHLLSFQSERNFLLFLIAALLVFFLLKNLFSVWVNYVQAKLTAEIGVTITESQLNKYLNFPFWDFNDLGSVGLINSVLNVPAGYVSGVLRILVGVFSEGIIVAVIVVSILIYKPLLIGLLAIILGPAMLLTYRALRSRSQRVGDSLNKLRPISFSISNNLFTGFVELKLANKQDRLRDELIHNQRGIQGLEAASYLYSLLPLRIIEMVAILGVLIIFLYSILLPNASTSLITLVGLFAAAAYRLMPSINRILTGLVTLKQYQFTVENLEMYRDAKYSEPPHPQQLPLYFEHSLALEHVSFGFPNAIKPALHNLSLTIRKGEKIGFIGSSGSGKTTLMNILLRFYREQSGQVTVDGQPLTAQHLKAWHDVIGYVKQDTFLMEASIKDNITLGDKQVDNKRLLYALEQASLQDFIANLPDGVETMIGERGSKLSGGQRQRIGIARAMYKHAQVLILDEATSALDNETEREVSEAINKLSHTDITILIVAHRITTLRDCNRIYELKDGKIWAEHQYADLIQKFI
jgi:ABC-type multidrug transport system fused ATPase/permease subunit